MGIVEDLNSIMKARYGKDVRQAIHDSISEINDVANDSKNAAITAQNSASASAASANTSASNAKYSEDKAKDYMEKAFAAIPEGYEEFVDDVIELKSDISFKDHDTATSGTSFTDAKDGNMLVTDWTKNLLNPTLETCEINGVTCTNNGDGTYTLNGTATDKTEFTVFETNDTSEFSGKKVRMVGCPAGSTSGSLYSIHKNEYNNHNDDVGSGCNVTFNGGYANITIIVASGTVLDNLTFKPMLTTDLSATYDDFVPYGGYEIQSCGKNLISYPYYRTSGFKYEGITFDILDDLSIHYYGTATTRIWYSLGKNRNIQLKAGHKYLFSIDKIVGDKTYVYFIDSSTGSDKWYVLSYTCEKIVFTQNLDTIINIGIQIADGGTVDETVKIMLQECDESGNPIGGDAYEPYTGETITVTNDTESPAFGLKSHKGITNIISPGNVKCVYPTNESGKGVLDSLYNKDKVLTEQNKSLEVLGKCKNLLKPTLETCEKNGITCTNNGDGTYTLNGTANANTYLIIKHFEDFEDRNYRVVMCKNPDDNFTGYINAYRNTGQTDNAILHEVHRPTVYISNSVYKTFLIGIAIGNGTTLSNEIIKPMLLDTDLCQDVTYDDFVPYTGDGETLTHDVATLKYGIISDKWNASRTYNIGEYCIYDDKMWKCLITHANQTPAEGVYWTCVSIKAELERVSSDVSVLDSDFRKIKKNFANYDQTEIHVDGTNGSDNYGNGSSANPYKTISYALSSIPKILNGKRVVVRVTPGTYNEDVVIKGFNNGELLMFSTNSSNNVIINSLRVQYCSGCYVYINNFRITSTSGVVVGYADAELYNCIVDLTVYGGVGFLSNFGRLSLTNCKVSGGTGAAVCSKNMGEIFASGLSGNCNGDGGTGIAYRAFDGGKIYIGGSVSFSAPTMYSTNNGGRIYADSQSSAPNY